MFLLIVFVRSLSRTWSRRLFFENVLENPAKTMLLVLTLRDVAVLTKEPAELMTVPIKTILVV